MALSTTSSVFGPPTTPSLNPPPATSPGFGSTWNDTRPPSGNPDQLGLPPVLRGTNSKVAWIWDEVDSAWTTQANYRSWGPNPTETPKASDALKSALLMKVLGTGSNPFQNLNIQLAGDNPIYRMLYNSSRSFFKTNDGNYLMISDDLTTRGFGRQSLVSDYENIQAHKSWDRYGFFLENPELGQKYIDARVGKLRSRWAAMDYLESKGISTENQRFPLERRESDVDPFGSDFVLDQYTGTDGKQYFLSGKPYSFDRAKQMDEKAIRFRADGSMEEMTIRDMYEQSDFNLPYRSSSSMPAPIKGEIDKLLAAAGAPAGAKPIIAQEQIRVDGQRKGLHELKHIPLLSQNKPTENGGKETEVEFKILGWYTTTPGRMADSETRFTQPKSLILKFDGTTDALLSSTSADLPANSTTGRTSGANGTSTTSTSSSSGSSATNSTSSTTTGGTTTGSAGTSTTTTDADLKNLSNLFAKVFSIKPEAAEAFVAIFQFIFTEFQKRDA